MKEQTELIDHSAKPTLPLLKEILQGAPEEQPVESLPSPPPITVHDFWANVVRNYRLVHRTMPGFLFHKIRDGGIPSVLRRIVWTAMAGITPDYMTQMSQVYARLEIGGVHGGWERDIGRDLNRTWPDVHMFKEQNGEGQRGLRGVLGAYSVWDHEVGYCQGYLIIMTKLMQTRFLSWATIDVMRFTGRGIHAFNRVNGTTSVLDDWILPTDTIHSKFSRPPLPNALLQLNLHKPLPHIILAPEIPWCQYRDVRPSLVSLTLRRNQRTNRYHFIPNMGFINDGGISRGIHNDPHRSSPHENPPRPSSRND